MSLIKGIIKYIFILLLIGLGACVLLGAAMMLFNVEIMGYHYISANEKKEYTVSPSSYSRDYYENADKIRGIEVSADNMNVTIYPHNENFFTISSLIQGNGFARTDEGKKVGDLYTTLKPTMRDNGDGTYTLVITSKTADGLINLTHHKLEIAVPSTSDYPIAENLQNVSIKTKAGNIIVTGDARHPSNDDVLRVSKLTKLESTRGNITVQQGSINNLNAKTESGKMVFESAIGNIKGIAEVESNIGNIRFEKGVNILGNCLFKSGISRITLNDITSKFEYEGESAYLEIGTVTGQVQIKSSDAVVNIKEIKGSNAWISAGYNPQSSTNNEPYTIGNRQFRIGKAEVKQLFLETNTGEIRIDELTYTSEDVSEKKSGNLLSASGNITIGKLIGSVSAITKSGNVKINQATYAESPANANVLKDAYIKVQSEKGNVVLNNIVGEVHVKVKDGGNAPIDVTILEVNHHSEILGQKGNMKITLPENFVNGTNNIYSIAFFKLNEDLSKMVAGGSVDINISSLSSINDKNLYYYVQYVTDDLQNYGEAPISGKPVVTLYTSTGDIDVSKLQ